MLIDGNLIVYVTQPDQTWLRPSLVENATHYSMLEGGHWAQTTCLGQEEHASEKPRAPGQRRKAHEPRGKPCHPALMAP